MTVALIEAHPVEATHVVARARAVTRFVVLALSALVLVLGLPVPQAAAATAPEFEFLKLVNAERTSRGIAPLVLSDAVTERVSRPWSSHMAATNVLAHSGTGLAILRAIDAQHPGVSTAGENVGYAGSIQSLHGALMASPGHRANILSTSFRYVGIGLVQAGSRYWVTQSFFNTSSAVGAAAPAVDPAAAARTQKFVSAVYVDFLGRDPDPAGMQHWSSQIDSGRMTTHQVAYGLANSDEWLTVVIRDLYRQTLGRDADPYGLRDWLAAMRSGLTVSDAAARFYASDEYYALAGGTMSSWLTDLYRKQLNREPDPVGLQHWAGVAQREGRFAVTSAFYASHEPVVRRIDGLYQHLLLRGADPAGLTTWPAIVRSQGDLVLAAYIAASMEYWNRAQTR